MEEIGWTDEDRSDAAIERLLDTMSRLWESTDLTRMERVALLCLSHGLTPAKAAEMLGITQTTIRRHLNGASRKLRTKSSVHAMAQAMRAGLIP